ncbi:hypothetical protein WME79_11805 [Sorangium sp. So ce726]|uniref:hypothetical protein n=1 Tax=Sorangium sp. So ce726 TaxID=3133319 RepID=UPI003F5E5501
MPGPAVLSITVTTPDGSSSHTDPSSVTFVTDNQNCYCLRRPLVIHQYLWRDDSAGANRRDPSLPRGSGGSVTTDRTPSGGMGPTRAQRPSPGLGELAVTETSRRAAVVALLASTLSRAVALGDEAAARVVHEAIGRLLGVPVASDG